MEINKETVTSGIKHLDLLLDGGIIIGDNVLWYDNAGSLAQVFCYSLIQASIVQKKSVIYINFDNSPKTLLEKLGPLSKYQSLTILDCFTNGKGEGSEIFQKFYTQPKKDHICQIIPIAEPQSPDHVMGAFYGLHKTMKGDVRFIFDSLTGMQELWGGEEKIQKFYSHSCPRLYELNTIAYWIVEKEAHSHRLKAHLNKITQVAIDLSLKRGKTSLTVIKADKRDMNILNKTANYRSKGLEITFEGEQGHAADINIGVRLKELRSKKGLSQTELAKLVGVTPSTISQVENNQIFPSLPALFKMSEILSVESSAFFQKTDLSAHQVIFKAEDAVEVQLPRMPKESVHVSLLTKVGLDSKIEPYLFDILPETKLSPHFFMHKGEEMGYLLSGEIKVKFEHGVQTLHEGDVVHLKSAIPLQWENPGPEPVKLLWIKIK